MFLPFQTSTLSSLSLSGEMLVRCVLAISDLEAFSSTHSAIAHTCSRKYAEGFSLLRGVCVGEGRCVGDTKERRMEGKSFPF